MTRHAWLPVILSVLAAPLAGGGKLPVAAAAETDSIALPVLPSLPPAVLPPSIGAATAPPAIWWGTLNVARGGTDLVTVSITPQAQPGPGVPGLGAGTQWAVFGTWNRVCSPQQNFVSGTIGSDGRATLAFFGKAGAGDAQVATGLAGVGRDGRLYGSVTVVQGVDLNDTFSFVLDHQ